jgi:hypothetical protein
MVGCLFCGHEENRAHASHRRAAIAGLDSFKVQSLSDLKGDIVNSGTGEQGLPRRQGWQRFLQLIL